MNRLEKAMRAARSLVGGEDTQGIYYEPVVEPNNRLGKAIANCKRKMAGFDDDIKKGRHDALYYHALHAQAAESASCSANGDEARDELKDIAKKHQFMFLRHCLEEARKCNSPSSMKWNLRKICDFYSDLANDHVYPGYGKKCPIVEEFKNGRAYIGSPEDANFNEDYEDGSGPTFDEEENSVGGSSLQPVEVSDASVY